ncbi:hypothetical protein [Mycobacterium sp. 236(2023)]|uniref:hypothetical protein n=1 Tax=Mycobacterium sp. 236(2023) TaxID=3038163 RepID=UPI0024152542|nr:hypothetical protein [Mycobacterium sp. 236(2023)]MDG4663714.1 hypothetical protein [Mycobacterium sp. 236(2023)]
MSVGLLGFLALLVGTAATAALDRIDSYRMQVIGVAPCTKRALGFEPFEPILTWVSLGGLGVALTVGIGAVALSRSAGRRLVTPVLLVVVSALMLALAVVSHSSPFDFDDSSLPMCGAAVRLGAL